MLSKLASVAHERELRVCLDELSQSFERWRRGEIDTWQIDDEIHQFAQGLGRRRLFVRYNTKSILHMNVAQAIVRGLLRPAEVPEEVMAALNDAIAFYEKGLADGSISFEEED